MFQLITDACCDLPATVLDQEKVAYIPMMLDLDGKEYVDDLGQTFDYSWFLEQLKQNKQPTTSQINVGRFMEHFRPYAEKGIPLLYIGFSSGLSGSYNSSLQAVDLLKEEYPEAMIHCVDTKAASLGVGMLVMHAAAMQQAGKSLDEIVAWLETYQSHLRSWVTVDDLKHLERGGRISKAAAVMGGLLNVKPIIHVDAEGRLQNVDKVRGRNKAIQKIIQETQNDIDLSILNHLYIAHTGDDATVAKVATQLQELYPDTPITQFPLGPTIASHTGYGCIALFSMGTKER
ncbi:DegV family protein [Enterococcus saccharolyticus]|uniref:Fatty acid-binding protein DegV n=1 Tax=Candidatus Enterococcus willemsii TaxID=1857215 RepID=A0ABQ6YZI4_9ENTE|nr:MULTISPECIES: DegV family protein [Enterococcus]KAF1304039.1 fatty acid-binding protein DegV [Enterococcus sp. CU12B]MCD5002100.1 DegV family protein [Enterococcus saccharolyticus]